MTWSAINPVQIVSITSSITPTMVTNGNSSEQTFTFTGLLTTDRILNLVPAAAIGGPNIGLGGLRCTATNTLAITFINCDGIVSRTPTAQSYTLMVAR